MAKRKAKTKKKNLALIDGEIIAYHLVTNGDYLREESNDLNEFYMVLDMNEVQEEFELRIDNILHETNSNDHIIFFGSKENFRKKIEPSYKSNRKLLKPLGYWALVKWIKDNYTTNTVPKVEADDGMGMAQTMSIDMDLQTTVMVSNDKDMKTIPGLLYDHTNPDKGIINITEQEAAAWWGFQTLVGDTTDGYKGCPGVGAVGAQPLFDKFKSSKLKGKRLHKAVFKEVCSYFYEKGLGEKQALIQARLSRILHAKDYDEKRKQPILWKP